MAAWLMTSGRMADCLTAWLTAWLTSFAADVAALAAVAPPRQAPFRILDRVATANTSILCVVNGRVRTNPDKAVQNTRLHVV